MKIKQTWERRRPWPNRKTYKQAENAMATVMSRKEAKVFTGISKVKHRQWAKGEK